MITRSGGARVTRDIHGYSCIMECWEKITLFPVNKIEMNFEEGVFVGLDVCLEKIIMFLLVFWSTLFMAAKIVGILDNKWGMTDAQQ